jgi:8-oxo-dGTP diphosphatase
MMRTVITNIVRAIQPADATECDHITATLAWIASGAPLFRTQKPATPPRHLVSYFVLVDVPNAHILLVDHRKAGLWLPSGGHVEPGEHPATTVARELREELQLDAEFLFPQPIFLTVTQTVGTTAGHTDVSLWYVLHGDCRRRLEYDRDEFHRVAWFPLDRLPLDRTDPHMARFAQKLAAVLDASYSREQNDRATEGTEITE